MLSYFSSFFNYLFGKNTLDECNSDSDLENFLAEQLLDLEISSKAENSFDNDDVEIEITNEACFQRTGVITYMAENKLVIDDRLSFELNNCPIRLNVKDRIRYMGYNKQDVVTVVRIIENLGQVWGDQMDVEEKKFEVFDHVIIGEVDDREDRLVFMKDSDLRFSLDEVEATFVPVKGDWLELKCTVQLDEEKPCDVSPAQVVKVSSLKALRSRAKSSSVTRWDGRSGVCDNNIYFDRLSLNGADPHVGMKVLLDAIESNQGHCNWRALRIIPDDTVKFVPNNDIPNEDLEEEKSLQLEQQFNIEMTHPLKFDKIGIQDTANATLNVTNNSNQPQTITKWKIMGKRNDSQLFIKPYLSQPVTLAPKQTYRFTIICRPKFLGNSKELLVIVFRGFQLKRMIEINVVHNDVNMIYKNAGSSDNNLRSEHELMENMKTIRRQGNKSFVPGVMPVKPPNFIPVRLGNFPIPDKVWSAVLGDSDQTVYTRDYDNIISRIEENLPCLASELTINNYTDKWHTLMYMEEIQQNIHMRQYDIPKTFLDRHQEYLGIEIMGLSEKRPSLIQGDKVIVKDIWDVKSPQFEGFIHALRGNLVLIKFHHEFHETYSGSDVSVEFHFSRSVYRRCHQAINLALSNLGPDLLFPSRIACRKPQVPLEKLQTIDWFNQNLNIGQKTAVKNILMGECRPMPYCIYGPPGTGKTITVIETILQILTFLPDSRILVATPSNSAANLIVERLIQYRKVFSDSIIRLIANHLLNSDSLPDFIKPFCATLDIARENTAQSNYSKNKDGINLHCRTHFVGRHRVTIGTCFCLGSLAQMGLPKGHFTHVIIDEAGQATEPEIMIPMTFTDKENGQIILAGDPMQLGPVVTSKYCKEFGLDESYLSRVLERFPYQKDFAAFKEGYDRRLVTKLNDNYRSLEEVLTLPSQMFYDGSLVPRINRNQDWITRMLDVVSDIFSVEEKNGGIYVYGIRGVNARAEDSPSWFNPQEASMVALTVCKLYKKNITPDEIGVITPYIAQIKHLRLVFDAMGLPQPKIGSVEEFQGQERPIIIISTVRSTESYLQDDHKHTLGFVKQPKRLNVALTRAQVAVLLFCNPHLLCKDQMWNKVISHAVKVDTYAGCDLPSEVSNIKDNE